MTPSPNLFHIVKYSVLLGFLTAASVGRLPLGFAGEANCAAPLTTLDMQICGDASFKASVEKLSEARKRLNRYLDEEQRTAFDDADTKWLQFRESNCKSHSLLYSGGSLESVESVNCRASMTEERFNELNELYKYLSTILVPRDTVR